MSKKRVLWLFNHTSLRKFVVPLLIELGYEVYCPKCFTAEVDYSASVSYEYDSSLSIPKCDLDILNGLDFYEGLNSQHIDVINRYFDIAIVLFYPCVLDWFATHFKGILVTHVFGLSKDFSYADVLWPADTLNVFRKISNMGERFWFAPSYENILDIECSLFKERALYLPIGLANTEINNKWEGGDKRFLFIGPKINSNSYYRKVYEDFKKNFGDIPHVIGGAQPIEVDDDTVTGFLSAEDYEYNMRSLSCMFYHSQEPRHVHYHPFEAIKNGMPLIFMAGGMLDNLGGKTLPGRCESIKDARQKIKKLINGDKDFIKAVCASQGKLLHNMSKEYCMPFWVNGMQKLENCGRKKRSKKKIGIVMPANYKGGVFDYTVRFIKALHHQILVREADVELAFICPGLFDGGESKKFEVIKKLGIEMRGCRYKVHDRDWAMRVMKLAGYTHKSEIGFFYGDRVVVMHDDISDFSDIDYMIFSSDGIGVYPFFSIVPYMVVVHDYIQRYVPEIMTNEINYAKLVSQRQADRVMVTSKAVYDDAMSYAGIPEYKLIQSSHLCEFESIIDQNYESTEIISSEYIMWSCNASPHKNHVVVLRGLEKYYEYGGRLDCIVTGADTELFSVTNNRKLQNDCNKKYISNIRAIVQKSRFLRDKVHFLGSLPKAEYLNKLQGAAFIMSPQKGDNGSFCVADGAALGVPAMCNDYPGMRCFCDFFDIPVHYFSALGADDVFEAIRYMECNGEKIRKKLPSKELLMSKSYMAVSSMLYENIKYVIGFSDEQTGRENIQSY